MQCPQCRADNPDGQKFCGACGHKLVLVCLDCQAVNPPDYKFCGQCGAGLTDRCVIALARSGLITRVNQKALDLMGHQQGDVQGKPFSLFVVRSDLVIFFSHLNELFNKAGKQIFDITLKHKTKESIHVRVEGRPSQSVDKSDGAVELCFSETDDQHQAAVEHQRLQEFLGLILSITHHISTAGKKHLAPSIEDALKKIALFTEAEHAFIYAINRPLKHLVLSHQWQQSADARSSARVMRKPVPLSRVKHVLAQLHREKETIIGDTAALAPPHAEEWHTWLSSSSRAAIAVMIYSEKVPVAVLGVSRPAAREWMADDIGLVRFFGDFLTGRPPYAAVGQQVAGDSAVDSSGSGFIGRAHGPIADDASEPDAGPALQEGEKAAQGSENRTAVEIWSSLPDMTQPMVFEKITGTLPEATAQQSVFARDDGLVSITCPKCGSRESLSVAQFDTLGNAIAVACPCRNRFVAVLERRRAVRKNVNLEGYFSVSGDLGPTASAGSIWGQMKVTDLSKFGLRFSSEKAHLVHPGDQLMVRFNLDNSNKALIHKPAKVISVSGLEVGCQFVGADSYDITLGFYFM